MSEKKNNEKLLQQREEKYRMVADFTYDWEYWLDENKKLSYISPSCERITGYVKQMFFTDSNLLFKILHPDDQKLFHQKFIDIFENNEACHLDFRIIRKDGKERWINLYSQPVYDSEGYFRGRRASNRDITDRKKAEQEVLRVKEYTQRIIDSASELIISFDQNNTVLLWNKTAETVTGYKQKEVIGKNITTLQVFDNSKEFKGTIQSVIHGKKPEQIYLILKTKINTKRIISLSGSIIKAKAEEGEIQGCLFIGKDITQDIEQHGKLLGGNSYLIANKNNTPAFSLFISLISADYKGLYITRNNPEIIKNLIPTHDVQIVVFSEKKQGSLKNISTLDSLITAIHEFCKKHDKTVILLDRIDYLLNIFSFDQVSKSLYKINEIISNYNTLFLLHLDPILVDQRQLSIIEHEIQPLPSQKLDDVYLNNELYDILQFIDKQNMNNIAVSFKKIGKHFSIVSKTTTKRLRQLENEGLILIKKQGRLKTLHVSEKGKQLLNNRHSI
jgi:PAS domain S-box-containing protein